MTDTYAEKGMKYDSEQYRKFIEDHVNARKLIDSATAKMSWGWERVLDPYGVLNDLPEEGDCIGRAYFLRAPDSDIWVSTYDLPEATRQDFWRLLDAGHCKDEDFDLE